MSYSRRLENVLEQTKTVENNLNKNLIKEFSKYLISKDTSTNYQRNCVKVILMYGDFLQSEEEEETYRRQKEHIVFYLLNNFIILYYSFHESSIQFLISSTLLI